MKRFVLFGVFGVLSLIAMAGCKKPAQKGPADPLAAEAASQQASASLESWAGSWRGDVLPQLPLVLHLEVEGAGDDAVPTATLDSPNQHAYGIETQAAWDDGQLVVTVDRIGLTLMFHRRTAGEASEQRLEGTFSQGTITGSPLSMRRTTPDPIPARPQEPGDHPPYAARDVSIESTGDVVLAGTLTEPPPASDQATSTAVVLVSGSGPQDRDEALMGHRPFLVLADQLTRNGITVLRYDDRGVAQSSGTFAGATTDDFAVDAAAALAFLKSQGEFDAVGYVGHSEGAIVGPLAHAIEPADFLVLLAGPTIPGDDLLQAQKRALGTASGMTSAQLQMALKMDRSLFDVIEEQDDPADVEPALNAFVQEHGWAVMLGQDTLDRTIAQLSDPWMVRFLGLDPAPALEALDVPALALFGEKDLQVPPDVNAPLARELLGEAAVKVLPGLNHLFQPAETGLPEEYGAIEITLDPSALREILVFVKSR